MKNFKYISILTLFIIIFLPSINLAQIVKEESDYTVSIVLPEAAFIDSVFRQPRFNPYPRPNRSKEYFDHFKYSVRYSIKVEGHDNSWNYPVIVTVVSPLGEKQSFYVNSEKKKLNTGQLYNFRLEINSKIKGIARMEVDIPTDLIDQFLDKNIQVTLVGSDVYLN